MTLGIGKEKIVMFGIMVVAVAVGVVFLAPMLQKYKKN